MQNMIAQEYAKPPSPTNLGRTYPVPLPHAPHRLRVESETLNLHKNDVYRLRVYKII